MTEAKSSSETPPQTGDDESKQLVALLEEFKVLRAEIAQRSTAQSALITLNVTAIGVVIGAALSRLPEPDGRILFVIPILSPILGFLFLDHGLAIRNIGQFIQFRIKPMINGIVGLRLPDYEAFVEQLELRRIERFSLLGVPVFILFCALPAIALAVPFFLNDLKAMKQDAWLFGAPGILLLLCFLPYWTVFVWTKRRSSDDPPHLSEPRPR
jgi:hypothetical protein